MNSQQRLTKLREIAEHWAYEVCGAALNAA